MILTKNASERPVVIKYYDCNHYEMLHSVNALWIFRSACKYNYTYTDGFVFFGPIFLALISKQGVQNKVTENKGNPFEVCNEAVTSKI